MIDQEIEKAVEYCLKNERSAIAVLYKNHSRLTQDFISHNFPKDVPDELLEFHLNRPSIRFKNGNQIRFVSESQGPQALEGFSLDGFINKGAGAEFENLALCRSAAKGRPFKP